MSYPLGATFEARPCPPLPHRARLSEDRIEVIRDAVLDILVEPIRDKALERIVGDHAGRP
jgi:hypothetical protein